MRAIRSGLAVLVVFGLVGCGGKSGEDGRIPSRSEGDDTERDAGGDAGTQASEGVGSGSDEDTSGSSTSSGSDTSFADDCSEGDVDCPCYPNASCNDELACVAGRCIERSEAEVTGGAGEARACSDAERGTLGCTCYGNDTCNGTLVCVADTCQSGDAPSGAVSTVGVAGGVSTSGAAPAGSGTVGTTGEPIDTDGDGVPDAIVVPITEPAGTDPGAAPTAGSDPGSPAAPTGIAGGGMVAPPSVGMPGASPDGPVTVIGGDGEPIDVDGLDVGDSCQPLYVSVGRDSCGLELECEEGWLYSSCWQNGSDWQCDCQSQSNWMSLVLENGSSTDACTQTANLCAGGVQPEFTEEPVCQTDWETADTNYCEQQIQCTQTADLGDGVTATLNDWQYSWCQETDDGEWSCYCQSNNAQVQFEMPGTDSAAVCDQAIDICGDASSAEPSGSIECDRTYQSAGPNYCSAEIGCTQTAIVNDVEVGMYGSIWTNCEQSSDGTFTCYCQSGSDSAEFDVESDDAWSTCSGAVETCQELVAVQIGNGGMGGIGIGRPIPADY